MKNLYLFNRYFAAVLFTLLFFSKNSFGQRIYATSQASAASGTCVGCNVTSAANAADGNPQTASTINLLLGVGIFSPPEVYQEMIFASPVVAANTPVTVKLGTGDKLLSLTALGGVTVQAYNKGVAVGTAIATSTLITALSNTNEFEATITPNAAYDRVRVTLNGGLIGLAANIYVYDAYYKGTGNTACSAAIDELHGISTGLLNLGVNVGGVANPQQAIDGNIATASTLNAGIGAIGATTQQTVIFGSPSVIGDSIRVTLSIPATLISAGVLSNLSIQTYNGNASNGDTQTLSSGLLTLRLLDAASNTMAVTFVPTKIFDRVQLTLGGGIAAVLSSVNLYEAQKLIPSPVVKYNGVVTNSVQLCSGGSATLVANAITNTTFNWYTVPTGGSPVATGSSFTAGPLTTATTYYVEAMRNGCTDASTRTAVVVNVNAIPAAPVVANNALNICAGQTATFTTTPVSGVTVNWYAAATGGTPIATGNNFTTTALNATTTYYAEAVAGGTCISPTRTQVTATVSAIPATPTIAVPNVTICDGAVAVFSVTSPIVGISYNWYSAQTGGTILHTGTDFTTDPLHTNANYYVEAVNATGCNSTLRAQATVTVQPIPAAPTVAANSTTITAGQTAAITVTNAQTGITYNWYTSATASTPVFSGTTYTTPALFSTTTYYVSAANATGCTSATRTTITINVTTTAAPCSFANIQTKNVSGLCIACGVTNDPLATDADTTTASTISVPIGLLGAYAEQQLVFQQPGVAGDIIKLGLQTPASLATVGLLGQIQVTVYNGATVVNTYTLDNPAIKLTLLGGANKSIAYIPATGVYDRITVRLTSGVATLLNSLQILYATQQFAKPVISPASPEICSGSTAVLNITPPTVGSYSWFAGPTGGAALATSTNTYTTAPLTTNTTYYLEYTRNGCTSPTRFPIQVLVDNPPAAPTAALSNVTINSGQTATLSASAPANATIKWYADPTGGVALGTGSTFTTPALTANTTYYAESSLGSCTSPTRTPVTVTVNAVVIPNVTVTPPTQAVDAGTAVTFTASSTTPGAIFNWFSTPTGGTSLSTGAVYTTPSIFTNTTFYAEASVPATGAVSATRATGVVTVNATTTSAVPCDAAIDQLTATSGLLCLGCSVNNPTGSVDADRNTFSQLSVPIGLVNAYAQQTLRFAATARLGDSVIVELGIPAALASVGVLSQISLATYNGATYNNDRTVVDGSLINISLLNGTSRFRIAFKAGADFDRVEIRMNAGVAGVFNTLNIYDAYQEVAAPTVAAAAVTACQGTQTTLTATAPSYVTVKWYTAATGGTPVFTGNVFTTPVLNSTITYYAEASRTGDGCAQAVRTPVVVTVTPVPVAPVVATPTVTTCAGQPATFAATPVTGVTFNWYSTPTGGTPLFTGNSYTTGALNVTTSFYVEAEGSGQCGSTTRTMVTAVVNPALDNAVVANSPVQICSGSSAILSATSTQPGVTFNWYAAATGGTPIFTGSQFTTPALIANTSYFVEVASGNCTSAARTEADVIVNPAPANPTIVTVPADGQILSGQTAQITASSTTTGATFNWYTSASGGTAIFTGATFTTPALSSSTTYYVEAANSTGCTSPQRTAVTINIVPTFSTNCDFASTETSDVNNGILCVGCGVTDHTLAVDNDLTTFSRLMLPVAVGGSYVSQTLAFANAGHLGDTVTVKIGIPAGLATVGVLNQLQIASYNGATFNNDRTNISSSLIKIQLLSGGTTALIKFAPQVTFDRVEVRLTSGLAVFNETDIYYASMQVEAPVLAATTVNICANNTATFTVTNTRAGVTYNWYTTATGGSPVATNTATFTTGPLTATTTYYVESVRTSSSCPNPNRVAVTANVTPGPPTPTLFANSLQICSGDQATFTVTNANGATVNWYDAAVGGTLLFTGPSYQASPVTNATYYAEISNGTCSSAARAQATVTVNPRPLTPGLVASNVQICNGSTANLQVNAPEVGVTYKWYATLTGGTPLFTGATVTTGPLTQNTTYYVNATNTTTGCTNMGGRVAVNISVTNQPAAPTLSATNTTVCANGSASISVVNPITGTQYNWYSAAVGGTLLFTGTTYSVNNLTASVSFFVQAVTSGGCSSTGTETDITVLPVPPPPTIQAPAGGLASCNGAPVTISIANPQPDQVYRWFDAATNGTLLFVGTQYTTPTLTATTTYYVEAATAGNCNPSARTPVTITISPLPSDPTIVANMVSVCSGSNASFSVSSPQTGVSYNWYDTPQKTNLLFTGVTYITNPITATTNFFVEAANAGGCTSMNMAQAQVTVQPSPAAPAIANGATVATCSGAVTTLNIANPQAGYTYSWYASATGGAALFTGTTFATPALSTGTTYYAQTNNASGCGSATRTPVSVTINAATPTPIIAAVGTSVCPGSTTTLAATNTDSNITINWYSAATGGTLLATGNNFTTPVITANTTYYADATNNTTGCVSPTRTAVNVTIVSPLAAPVVTLGTTTTSSIIFNWTAVNGATGYQVSTDNGITFSAPITALTYTVTGLKYNQSVTAVVRTVGASACQLSNNSSGVTGVATNPLDDGIFVPNAFTPNGDGHNDILLVFGTNIKSLNLWIYDQWGEMQFKSSDKNLGWDGTYKGRSQPVGVYVYYLEATMNNGVVNKKKGTITLLR